MIYVAMAYYLIGVSLVAAALYGLDKLAAMQGWRRIPETWLHLLGLLGGWPGALVARRVFRHKTQKQVFVLAFWVVVTINVGATFAIWTIFLQGGG